MMRALKSALKLLGDVSIEIKGVKIKPKDVENWLESVAEKSREEMRTTAIYRLESMYIIASLSNQRALLKVMSQEIEKLPIKSKEKILL